MKRFVSLVIILCIFIAGITLVKKYLSKPVNQTSTQLAAAPVGNQSAPVAGTQPQQQDKIADPAVNVTKLEQVSSSVGLKATVLKAALNAYSWAYAHGKLGSNKDTITVVDFSLPSYAKRMWVLSLHQAKVLMTLYTTQGSGSGVVYATHFSNVGRSQSSSLGLYVTAEEYSGKHGESMRLDGLQKGFNDNARARDVVVHSAAYASPEYIRAFHRAGRSWGCFAVAPAKKDILLHYIKGGSVFFAYAKPIEKTAIVSQGPLSLTL